MSDANETPPENDALVDGAENATDAVNDDAADTNTDDTPDPVKVLQDEVARLKDAYMRGAADMENLRRRAEKEKQDARDFAVERFAKDLLAVADNFDRALSTRPEALAEDEAFRGFATGIELTSRELAKVLEAHGVQRVGNAGDKFDPAVHQAMAQVPNDSVPNGHVAEVFAPGYVLKGRVLRAAMVVVSAGPAN